MGLKPATGLSVPLESWQAEALGLSGVLGAVDADVAVGVAAAFQGPAFETTTRHWI